MPTPTAAAPLPLPPSAQRQKFAPFIFMLVLTFFLFTSPDQNPSGGFASPRDYAVERIVRSRQALDVLSTSRWGGFNPREERWLNLTGFKEGDGYAWGGKGGINGNAVGWGLDGFKRRAGKMSERVRSGTRGGEAGDKYMGELAQDMFFNVTGIVRGMWVKVDEEEMGGLRRGRELNLSGIAPGVDWAYRGDEEWSRNITGAEGKLMLRFDERIGYTDTMGPSDERRPPKKSETNATMWHTGFVRQVAATLTIQDESSMGDGWDMKVHGVHWPRDGVLLMTTTSDKFAGIFGLPHLTPDANYFSTSQKLLNRALERTVKRMEGSLWADGSNPWSSSPESQGDAIMPVPHCEFVIYAQMYQAMPEVPSRSRGYLDYMSIAAIERELRFPTGAPIPPVPAMQMSVVMFSPDCGFMLESKGPPGFSPKIAKHLVGQKQEIYLRSVQRWLLALGVVLFCQTLLLSAQSKEASTPSTVGRVSLYTIGMMLSADALLFSTLALLSSAAPNVFSAAFLSAAFGVMSTGLGVRFSSAIYNVQEPERRERLRAQEAAEAASIARRQAAMALNSAERTVRVISETGVDVATTTTTRPPEDLPIIIPSDQDISAEILENTTTSATAASVPLLPTTNPNTTPPPRPQSVSNFGALYARSALTLIVLLFTTLSSLSWALPFRTAYTHLLSTIYLSFWLPQIRRNTIRNCRKALLWKFVVGQSILRLLPFAYFYLHPDNILFATPDWIAFSALAVWVWIQVWVLLAQEVLGPRWGLPKSWTTEGWDYHPVLREDDSLESGGLPIGLSAKIPPPSSPTLERARTSEDHNPSGTARTAKTKRDGSSSHTTRSVDCAICMQILDVPVVPAGNTEGSHDGGGGGGAIGGVTGLLARRAYMVTPCRHVFHSACLEGWMRFRLQCPICRENLPPL